MNIGKWVKIAKKLASLRLPTAQDMLPQLAENYTLPKDHKFEVLDPDNPGRYMWINTKGERLGGDDYSLAITKTECAISRKMHQTHRELEPENVGVEDLAIEGGKHETMVLSSEEILPIAKQHMEQRLRPTMMKDRTLNPEFYS